MGIESITGKQFTTYPDSDHKVDSPPPPPTYEPPHTDASPTCGPDLRLQSRPVTLYAGSISPADVKQLGCGDCTLMASLLSLARTSEGQSRIRNMIQANPDGSWTVTVYRRMPAVGLVPARVRVTSPDIDHRGTATPDGRTTIA